MPDNDSKSNSGLATRRDFLKTSLAAAVAAPAMGTMLARSAVAAPVKGGHLRLAVDSASTTDTLDVGRIGVTFQRLIGYSCRGNLTEFDASGSAKPELAESWDSSNGGKTWQFKLRKGVTFSNGKSLTPEDVIASMNVHRGEKSTSSAKSQFRMVSDIKADGPDGVIFTLDNGTVDFPYVLSNETFNICPSVDGKLDMSGTGAGPYTLKEFQPGVRAALERNPNSYKSGYVDSAEIAGVSDGAARQAALASRNTDVINNPDLKALSRLKRLPGIRVESNPGRFTYWFGMNIKAAPFDNVDVRTALKYGIDREAFINTIMYGQGSIGNDQPITPSYRFYNTELKPKSFDPDKARFYLKKAGMAKLDLEFYTSELTFAGALDLAQLYQQQAAQYGVNIAVNRLPADGYWDKLDSNTLPFYQDVWGGFTTEDAMFNLSLGQGAPWNHTFWDNKEFNDLLTKARGEEDEAKRQEMYFRMQELTSEDAGSVVPIFANSVHAVADKVKSGALATNQELDGCRCIERWWIEE